MKHALPAVLLICILSQSEAYAQANTPVPPPNYNAAAESPGRIPNETVASDISRISQSVEALNRNLSKFFTNFSSNQGLKLSERQQRLLFALEVLSRTEAALFTAQKQRLDHAERQSRLRLQLAGINDNLLPRSLDRWVSTRGTMDAPELRESRRLALQKEQHELSVTIIQIQVELDRLAEEIRRSELQVAALRARMFGEVEKELADL